MASIDDARKRLGENFIVGFKGFELSDDTSAFLSQAQIGGVILTSQNYESPAQVAELTNQIQECRTDLPLWICVDQEGGKVQSFKKPFTKIPDAPTISRSDSPKLAFELAQVMAAELKAVGVNVNFAPVVDIALNLNSPLIPPRAFGTTEEQVTKMATAIVRGHLVKGVQACVKHFPGHGATNSDSHHTLAKVDVDLATLQRRELKPFVRAFKSRCNMVMTAHLLYPQLDPDLPATLSEKILKDLMRKEMRYSRLIVADDLEMKSITDHFGAEEAPVMALKAGCDLLIYKTEEGARHAYTSVSKALEDGKLDPGVIMESSERSQAIKNEALYPYTPIKVAEIANQIGTKEHQEIIKQVEDAAAASGKS